MKNLLLENSYTFDETAKIWSRPQYQGIAYSDGDETENRIGQIIKNAKDVSIMSDELKLQCVDWPTHYYLNKNRVNLLRHFTEQLKNANVLEIGAGCGAITRFLGECQANVFALEGSKRRASIARERCRDLPNVELVSENFTEFKLNQQFDVITLIGVLEYANWFTPGENPALEMLKKVRGFLKPNGVLIIAIENQIGLKYYAGTPEDHLGERMIGIEGRYKKNGPQTFGKHVLEQMLKTAGFAATEFSAPFPDYKLPLTLITQAGFNMPAFKAQDLAAQSVTKDQQFTPPYAFSQESAWGPLFDNKIALDVSNSFLITASLQAQDLELFNASSKQVLAYYYSTNRIAQYCKKTTFIQNSDDTIQVLYSQDLMLMKPQEATIIDPVASLEFTPKTTASYYSTDYVSFSQLLQSTVKTKNWTYQDLAKIVLSYLNALEQLSGINGLSTPFNKNKTLPAQFFDAITQNVLWHQATGKAVLIDEEWKSSFEPTVGYLLFRSFIPLFSELTITAPSAQPDADNIRSILEGVFVALGSELNSEDLIQYEKLELPIQRQVTGYKTLTQLNWYRPHQLISSNAVDFQFFANQGMTEFQSASQMRAEFIYLRSVKQQFDSLLEKNENLFTAKNTNSTSEDNYHERLLRIYNSKLWALAKQLRGLITKTLGK